eukprot:579495-Rhodomonas_salina.4
MARRCTSGLALTSVFRLPAGLERCSRVMGSTKLKVVPLAALPSPPSSLPRHVETTPTSPP